MQIIEGLTDAETAEAHRSADVFAEVAEMTASLDAFLSLLYAFDWMDLRGQDNTNAYLAYPNGAFGLGSYPVVTLAMARDRALANARAIHRPMGLSAALASRAFETQGHVGREVPACARAPRARIVPGQAQRRIGRHHPEARRAAEPVPEAEGPAMPTAPVPDGATRPVSPERPRPSP